MRGIVRHECSAWAVITLLLAALLRLGITQQYRIPWSWGNACPQFGELRLTGPLTSSGAGRLELCGADGQWGCVCDDSFTAAAASVACRQMGYMSGDAVAMTNPGAASIGLTSATDMGMALDDVQCPSGLGVRLLDCPHNTAPNCGPSEAVGVVCHGPYDGTPNTCSDAQEATLRIVGPSAEAGAGRLEICHLGVWGTICDDDFGRWSAHVACRQMGHGWVDGLPLYQNTDAGMAAGLTSSPRRPIWLDQVTCSSAMVASLRQCSSLPWGMKDCLHDEDVGVACSKVALPDPLPASSGTSGPLATANSMHDGRLPLSLPAIIGIVLGGVLLLGSGLGAAVWVARKRPSEVASASFARPAHSRLARILHGLGSGTPDSASRHSARTDRPNSIAVFARNRMGQSGHSHAGSLYWAGAAMDDEVPHHLPHTLPERHIPFGLPCHLHQAHSQGTHSPFNIWSWKYRASGFQPGPMPVARGDSMSSAAVALEERASFNAEQGEGEKAGNYGDILRN